MVIGKRNISYHYFLWIFLCVFYVYDIYNTLYFMHILKDDFLQPLLVSFVSIASLVIMIYYAYIHDKIMASFFALILLLFSKFFMDYSIYELDNALSYIFFSALLLLLSNKFFLKNTSIKIAFIFTLLIFLLLIKIEYILIFFPLLVWILFKYKKGDTKFIFIIFSILLVGFLFYLFCISDLLVESRSTCVMGSLSQDRLLSFYATVQEDPVSLGIVIVGIILGLLQKNIMRPLMIGILFYLIYIILKIDKAYIHYNLFSIPVFMSVFSIINYFIKHRLRACFFVLFFMGIYWTTDSGYLLLNGVNQYIENKMLQNLILKNPMKRIVEKNVSNKVSPGIEWNSAQCHIFNKHGISIGFNKEVKTTSVVIGLDNNDRYYILFFYKNKISYAKLVNAKSISGGGISTRNIYFSKDIVFDKINIFPYDGDGLYSLGYLHYE